MMVKGSESFSAEEARRVVKAMKAHEREQLREAGQRKMSELRSLKAAVLKAHAAAKLQQQHSEGSVSSTYLTSNPSYESDSTQTLQQQLTSPAQGQQQPSHAAHQLNPQDATPQSVTTSSGSRDRPVSTPGSTAVKGTSGLGLCHSAPGSLGFLQPGSFSTVARAAGAVAAGAAAVAAAAAARAAAADPPAGPMDEDTAVSPAGPRVMQQQVEMQQAQQSTVQQPQQVTPQGMQKQAQQQQQQELEQQALPSVPDVSFQDPMVDMLLQQVEALMSEKQQLAAKCCGLERENEQLVELVGHLHDTLETAVDMQQQQQEGEVDTILEGDAEGVDEDGAGAFAAAAAAAAAGVEGAFAAAAAAEASVGGGCMDTSDDPMLTQSDSPTSTQEGVALEGADIGASAAADGGEGEDEVMVTASLPKIEVAAAAPQDAAMPAAAAATAGAPTDMLTDAPVSSAAAAAAAVAPNQVPTQTAAAAAAAAGLEERVIAQQKQMRVAEWLAHRVHEGSSGGRPPLPAAAAAIAAPAAAAAQSWQQWQEQLPLEAMSSGSSSTLTITLTDP